MAKREQRPKGQGAHLWVNQRKPTRYIYLRWNGVKNQVYLGPYRADPTAILNICLESMDRWKREHLKLDVHVERLRRLMAADKRERDCEEQPPVAYPELISLLKEKACVQPRPEPVLRVDDESRAVHHRELFHAAVHRMVEIRAARAVEKKFAKYRTTAPPQHTTHRTEVAAAR